MPVNNKISRKKKQQKMEFVRQANGVETLKSKESRQKVRRWTFVALVKQDGMTMPLSTAKVSFGSYKEALEDAAEIAADLKTLEHLKEKDFIVVPKPHETVSVETTGQLNGIRKMASLLDLALELCFSDLKLSSSSDAYKDMNPEAGKEYFYQRAVEYLKSKYEESKEAHVTDSESVQDGRDQSQDEPTSV